MRNTLRNIEIHCEVRSGFSGGVDMHRLLIAGALALGFSQPASTQQTVTCRETPTGLQCDTSAPQTAIDWRSVRPVPCTSLERISLGSLTCDARAIAASRKSIGTQVAEGKCAEGIKAALATGDFVFAKEVRDFCTAMETSPQVKAPSESDRKKAER
jgi:hypothetical protein